MFSHSTDKYLLALTTRTVWSRSQSTQTWKIQTNYQQTNCFFSFSFWQGITYFWHHSAILTVNLMFFHSLITNQNWSNESQSAKIVSAHNKPPICIRIKITLTATHLSIWLILCLFTKSNHREQRPAKEVSSRSKNKLLLLFIHSTTLCVLYYTLYTQPNAECRQPNAEYVVRDFFDFVQFN